MNWWTLPTEPRHAWVYDGPAYNYWGRPVGTVRYETTAANKAEAVRNINYRLRRDYGQERADHIDAFRVARKG